jgi:hypothetical protein
MAYAVVYANARQEIERQAREIGERDATIRLLAERWPDDEVGQALNRAEAEDDST